MTITDALRATRYDSGKSLNEDICIDTLRILSGNKNLTEMPHYDSLNWYLSRLSTECLAGIRKLMISKLIRSKVFDKNKALGKYWRIVLDGTGLFYFRERHCENCNHRLWITFKFFTSVVHYYPATEKKLFLRLLKVFILRR